MKKLKVLIICLLIIIVILIPITMHYLKKESKIIHVEEDEYIEHGEIEDDSEVSINDRNDYISDATAFSTINSCINQYINLLNVKNSIYYEYNEKNEYVQTINPYGAILQLISKKYKENNKISIENINNYVEFFDKNIIFVPLKIRENKNSKDECKQYIAYGILEDLNYNYIKDIYLYINVDKNNATFSIIPINKKYENIKDIEYTTVDDLIEKNDFNIYFEKVQSIEDICSLYLNTYKKTSLAKPEIIYNYLDEEYKKIRFNNLQLFKNYIQTNRKKIISSQLDKYSITDDESFRRYICVDKNGFYYIFNEKSIMDFTIILDAYTIDLPEFIEKYNKANEQTKVGMNIEKIVQAFNNKDYEYVYNKLDQTFKKNNFSSLDKFTIYGQKSFYNNTEIEYSKIEKEGNIYIAKCKLKDKNKSNNTKDFTFFMQLGENTDFVMSFSIDNN